MKIRKLFFLFLMVLVGSTMIFSASKIIKKNAAHKKIESEIEVINSMGVVYQETEKDLINKSKIQYQNKDIIGILKIEGAKIDTLLVQGRDNSYYLNHLINKKLNKTGSVFVDYRTDINLSKQVNIYGHSSSSYDIPFNNLKNYLMKEFYEKNKKILIITESGSYQYEIFSVKVTNNEEHMNVEYKNEKQWLRHLDILRDNSIYQTNVDVSTEDKILVLQTCIFNNPKGSLLIINLRKVNQDEKN